MPAASLYHYLAVAKVYLILAAPYLAAGAFFIGLVLFFLHIGLRRRLAKLALGKQGSIEDTIDILAREMKEAKEFRAELERYLKLAESRLRGAVQGVGLVRFNPFEGVGQGGNQSFALALIDERGMGVVFSTLYARDRVGVYAKPIENGSSTYELSDEEKSAIEKAKQQIAQNKIQNKTSQKP